MYKLQKICSHKIIHNISAGYKCKLARTIFTSRKEIIDTGVVLKPNNVTYNSGVGDSTSSCTNQDFQNIQSLHKSSLDSCDVIMKSENKDESDEFEQESSILEERNFEEQLASMFLKTHVQAKEILKLLRTYSCISQLYSDPRTVMKTPRKPCCIDDIAGGNIFI